MNVGNLEVINDPAIWENLINRSPQGTRFLDIDFLKIFSVPYTLYGYFKKGVCIAGIPIIDTSKYDGEFLPQCYYQGPFFYDEIYRSSSSKRVQYEIELVEAMLTDLVKVEKRFKFCLNTKFQDIRGYDWLHYHEHDRARCTVTPKYTAIVDLADVSHQDIRKNSRSSRRQEEGYAKDRELLTASVDGSISELLSLYRQTFDRQGKSISDSEINELTRYVNYFLSKSIGYILVVRAPNGQAVAGSFIFEDYSGTWHVPLVGIGDTRYGGTLLYYHIIDFAKVSGGSCVDFNGANSPQRGYFKHSVGARAQLYFEIQYRES